MVVNALVVGSVGRTRGSPETWGDLELTWRDGEARRDSHALWRGIAAALTPFALPQDLNDILLHQNQTHDRGDSHGG